MLLLPINKLGTVGALIGQGGQYKFNFILTIVLYIMHTQLAGDLRNSGKLCNDLPCL